MPTDKELLQLISTLSLPEKAALCSGASSWTTKANPARGIPALMMADGPHGLRYEDKAARKANGGASRRATCFPPEVAQACTFDTQLIGRVGAAIAAECLANGVGLLLGPGVNIKRGPLCGRNFEYYSEDPTLAGELAAAFINGLQENGVGASLKHYAVNNQERYRMSINALVDDRALFDIYLKAFEIAVRKAQPDTVMASYNKVNGTWATENRRLLTDILRLRLGFTGAVISDWGAVNDRPAGLAAGCDLEMPASGGVNDYAIVQAVESGFLPEDALDTACFNLLRLIYRRARPAPSPGAAVEAARVRAAQESAEAAGSGAGFCDYAGHHALAVEVLCKGAVLLKNGGPQADGTRPPMLPLAPGQRIAVIGEMAAKPRYQGGGSSHINPMQLVGFLPAMKAAGHSFVYAPGHAGTKTTTGMLAAAVAAAKTAGQVVLFLGLPDSFECEGYDRTHLRLPACQLKLLEAVAAANANLCVVLCCGGPVEMPWLDKARAVLCLHLGGEGLGEAAVKLLYGGANPSGKLAETWPLALEDTPAFHHFPMGPNEVSYNESLYVGYRYYDTAGKPVLFPFGHGLSYTSYAYGGLQLEAESLAKDQPLAFTLTVKNTGDMAGEEIVQAYVARTGSACFQPAKELKAFARVALEPGEEKQLRLEIPYRDLGFHDTTSGTQVVEQGAYTLLVGPNSRETPLQAGFTAAGVLLKPAPAAAAGGPYGAVADNTFPAAAFAALRPGPARGNTPPARGGYGPDTPLGLMNGSLAGRAVYRISSSISRLTIHFSADREANRRAAREMSHDLPFKNIVLHAGGRISHRAAAALLDLCNGEGSLTRLAGALLAKKPWRAREGRGR